MRGGLVVLVLALVGLFGASSIGYATYVVTRDSVGVPVTKLQRAPTKLAPRGAQPRTTSTPARPANPPRTTTTDDHDESDDGNSGKGSDNSGRGGGSHGGDDD
jgi:hypothetical protein